MTYQKISIEQFEWPDETGAWVNKCDLQVFRAGPIGLVIATDIGHGSGRSITNSAERLASIVCKKFDLNPAGLIWIEHYLRRGDAEETWDSVHFNISSSFSPPSGETVFSLVNPRWIRVNLSVVNALRSSFSEERNSDEPGIDPS